MTSKEALKVLVDNLDQARLKELSSGDEYWTKYEEVSEAINVLENSITEVENPPKQNPTKPTHKPIKLGKAKIWK